MYVNCNLRDSLFMSINYVHVHEFFTQCVQSVLYTLCKFSVHIICIWFYISCVHWKLLIQQILYIQYIYNIFNIYSEIIMPTCVHTYYVYRCVCACLFCMCMCTYVCSCIHACVRT